MTLRPADVRGHVRFRHVSFTYPSTARPLALAEAELAVDAASHGNGSTLDAAALADMGAADALDITAARVAGEAATVDGGSQPFGLVDVDFEAQPGQLVALVGPSGAGKTTTTYLLPRLYDVAEGAIEVDGRDVRGIRLASLGDVIGFVTQEAYLFHASLRQNLAYARPEATDRELQAAARLAAIHDRIRELPEGYDTVVGERGYNFVGGREATHRAGARAAEGPAHPHPRRGHQCAGQRQRAARSSGPSSATMQGRTTLAIAHRLSTILRADLILVYQRGRVVERGTHAQLLAQGGAYARLYHEQFEATSTNGPGPTAGFPQQAAYGPV